MLNAFQHHINQNFPFLQHHRCLLAVSGGIDSMVLVALCRQLDWTVGVAHCNFGLRGAESDEDEIFVREYCRENRIPFFVNRFNTAVFAEEKGLSIQMTARQLRYDWFETLRVREGYDYVLTAHQADDVLETFLINLTRGTGWDGLTGIPAQNGTIVRPLLPFSRTTIENYAAEYLISWREDSSNGNSYYQRNALRHEVVPVLKSMNPALLENFQKTLSYLQETKTLADWAVAHFLEQHLSQHGNEFHLAIHPLNSVPSSRALLYYWLRNYGFTAWEDIYQLPYAETGKQVLAPDFILFKNRTHLVLAARHEPRTAVYTIDRTQLHLNFPLKLTFCNVSDIQNVPSSTIFVDADLLEYPLTLRKWQEGDLFHPFGLQGTKKLSKFFKDEKFSLTDKERQWLLCSGNKIVWVIGQRADDRFKVTEQTQTILKITLSE